MKNQLMQLQILLTFVDPELANYLGQLLLLSVQEKDCFFLHTSGKIHKFECKFRLVE